MRAFVGVLLAAVALGGALAMHNEITETASCQGSKALCRQLTQAFGKNRATDTPGWVDPVAVVVAVAGVGCGLVLIARQRRLV
jgi:hypothetical protein